MARIRRARARTCEAPRQELDMMVLEFSSHDESAFTVLGKYCKEMKWRVAALGTAAIEIKLVVEKLPKMQPEVSVWANGNKLWPHGSKGKDKMKDNVEHRWPYRGVPKGMGVKNFFEVKPKAMGDNWYPAVQVNQRQDGQFEANVWLPDGASGWKNVHLPAVEKDSIREIESKRPLRTPERQVVLVVSKEDPLHQSTITLMDDAHEELITHYFARVTPPSGGSSLETQPATKELFFEVTKDRSHVKTVVSHNVLTRYLSADPQAIGTKPESRTKMTWEFRLGPFAEHTVTIEKKYRSSKICTLIVDGRLLIESSAQDFDCDFDEVDDDGSLNPDSGPWACNFRFIGERSVKFKVHEQNKDGDTLETTDLVEGLSPEQIKYTKVCMIQLRDTKDLTSAALSIDGVSFVDFKEAVEMHEESLECDTDVLLMQYGIQVPTKTRDEPPTGLAAVQKKLEAAAEQVKEQWAAAQPGLESLGGKITEKVQDLFTKQ